MRAPPAPKKTASGKRARKALTNSAASKSPLGSPAMSMNDFGFTHSFQRKGARLQSRKFGREPRLANFPAASERGSPGVRMDEAGAEPGKEEQPTKGAKRQKRKGARAFAGAMFLRSGRK
jgi:hypothetical protein